MFGLFRHKILIGVLLLFIMGLVGLVGWQVYWARQTPNLLANPNFEQAEKGWQIIAVGGAQTAVKPAADAPANPILALNIPATTQGGAGIGQRVPVTPLQRYQFRVNFRLVEAGQNSTQVLLRISQFDQAGQLIKKDEILNPVSPLIDNPQDWRALTHTFITDEQAAAVELGLGFFSPQAARVELDDCAFQVYPTVLSAIRQDIVASGVLVIFIGVIGYLVGRLVWPVRRQTLVNGGLVMASLVFTLMAAEIVVRFIPIRLIGSNWPRGYHVLFANGQSYRLAKNYPVMTITNDHGDQTEIMSNALGLRDIEAPPPTAGMTTVLILGDSMTFGVVGRVAESWPRRLNEQVAKIMPGPPYYHFVNAGVSGYNTFQEVMLFDALTKDMARQGVQPKVVFLSFFSEIWGRNLYGPTGRFMVMNDVVMYSALQRAIINLPRRLIEQYQLDDVQLIGPSRIQNLHQLGLAKSRLYFLLSLLSTLRLGNDWDARPEGVDPVAINYEALKSFKTIAEANGIRPVVVYLPKHDMFGPADGDEQQHLKQLAEICQRLQLTLINPYENMQKLGVNSDNAAEKLTLGYDSHYSVAGNLLYAQALAPLVADYLIQLVQAKK